MNVLLKIVFGAAVVLTSFFATLKLLDYFQAPVTTGTSVATGPSVTPIPSVAPVPSVVPVPNATTGPSLAVITDGPKNVTTKLACTGNPYPATEPDFHLTACVLEGEGTIPFQLNEKNQIACSKGKEISVFPSGRLRRCWVDAKITALKVTGTQQECSQAFVFIREDGYYYACNVKTSPR